MSLGVPNKQEYLANFPPQGWELAIESILFVIRGMIENISSKDALNRAVKNHAAKIVVTGELADKLYKGRKIAKLGAVTLGVLAAALAAVPFTGGLSALVGAGTVASLSGVEISLIVIALAIGLTLILAVYKDYDIVEYSEGRLVLHRMS